MYLALEINVDLRTPLRQCHLFLSTDEAKNNPPNITTGSKCIHAQTKCQNVTLYIQLFLSSLVYQQGLYKESSLYQRPLALIHVYPSLHNLVWWIYIL